MDMEREMRITLASLDLGSQEREEASSMITNMHELFMEQQRSVLANEAIPAEERNQLLRNSREDLLAQTQMIEALYGINIAWTDDITEPIDDITVTPPTPPAPPPTPPTQGGGNPYSSGGNG